jgi:hypothetical protein
MEAKKIKKIVGWTFVGLSAVYVAVMLIMCSQANATVGSLSGEPAFNVLSAIQKPIATTNIVFFVLLLGVSLWMYWQSGKKAITYLPVAIFTVFTLFCYVALSGSFYSIGDGNPTLSGSYWLMFFIGIFFVAGAIIITVISGMAVRNLLKRNDKGKE